MKARQLKPRARRTEVQLAEVAFKELSLNYSTWTQADQRRLHRMFAGLEWLDDDQAHVRGTLHEALERYDKTKQIEPLVAILRELVNESLRYHGHKEMACPPPAPDANPRTD